MGCSSIGSGGHVCVREQGQIAVLILASGTPSREVASTSTSMPGPSSAGDTPGTPDPAQWVTPGPQVPQKSVLSRHDCPAPLSHATRPTPGRTGEWRAGTSPGSPHTPRAHWLPPVEVMGQTDGRHSWTNNQAEQEQDLRIPLSHLPWALPTHPKPTARGVLCLLGDPSRPPGTPSHSLHGQGAELPPAPCFPRHRRDHSGLYGLLPGLPLVLSSHRGQQQGYPG